MVLVAVSCLSCSKTQENQTPQGAYTGSFQRITGGMGDTVHVTLILTGHEFSGNCGRAYYPSICNGTFNIKGSSLEFKNACFFTANFDWSLILDGKYQFTAINDSLVITRDYNGIFRDEYRLARSKN